MNLRIINDCAETNPGLSTARIDPGGRYSDINSLCIKPMLSAICEHENDSLVGNPDQLGKSLRVEAHDVGHGHRTEGLGALGLRSPQAKNT